MSPPEEPSWLDRLIRVFDPLLWAAISAFGAAVLIVTEEENREFLGAAIMAASILAFGVWIGRQTSRD